MYRIVIVEDDRFLAEELKRTCVRAGWDAWTVEDFTHVEDEIAAHNPDLVILDVNLPGQSGYDLCRSLKRTPAVSVLVLTARDTLNDELTALGLGADDFLTKPCPPERLQARVQRLLETRERMRNTISAAGLCLDVDTYTVWAGEASTRLAENEGRILETLMRRYPEVVGKNDLLSALWGTTVYLDENILQVNISRLRKALAAIGADEAIMTIRGKGYVLTCSQE